jgi:hypothetical protein
MTPSLDIVGLYELSGLTIYEVEAIEQFNSKSDENHQRNWSTPSVFLQIIA